MGCGCSKDYSEDYSSQRRPYGLDREAQGHGYNHGDKWSHPYNEEDNDVDGYSSSRTSSCCRRARSVDSAQDKSGCYGSRKCGSRCSNSSRGKRSATPRKACCGSSRATEEPSSHREDPWGLRRQLSKDGKNTPTSTKHTGIIPVSSVLPLGGPDGQDNKCQLVFNNEDAAVQSESYIGKDEEGVTHLVNRHNIRQAICPDNPAQGELYITIMQKIPFATAEKPIVIEEPAEEPEEPKPFVHKYVYMGSEHRKHIQPIQLPTVKLRPPKRSPCCSKPCKLKCSKPTCCKPSPCCYQQQQQPCCGQPCPPCGQQHRQPPPCCCCNQTAVTGEQTPMQQNEAFTAPSNSYQTTKHISFTEDPRSTDESAPLTVEPVLTPTLVQPGDRSVRIASMRPDGYQTNIDRSPHYAQQVTNNASHEGLYKVILQKPGYLLRKSNSAAHLNFTDRHSPNSDNHYDSSLQEDQCLLFHQHCIQELSHSGFSSPQQYDRSQDSSAEKQQPNWVSTITPSKPKCPNFLAEFVEPYTGELVEEWFASINPKKAVIVEPNLREAELNRKSLMKKGLLSKLSSCRNNETAKKHSNTNSHLNQAGEIRISKVNLSQSAIFPTTHVVNRSSADCQTHQLVQYIDVTSTPKKKCNPCNCLNDKGQSSSLSDVQLGEVYRSTGHGIHFQQPIGKCQREKRKPKSLSIQTELFVTKPIGSSQMLNWTHQTNRSTSRALSVNDERLDLISRIPTPSFLPPIEDAFGPKENANSENLDNLKQGKTVHRAKNKISQSKTVLPRLQRLDEASKQTRTIKPIRKASKAENTNNIRSDLLFGRPSNSKISEK